MLEALSIVVLVSFVFLIVSEKYDDREIERLHKELAPLNFPSEKMFCYDIVKRMRILKVKNQQEVYDKYRHCLRDWEVEEYKASGKIKVTNNFMDQSAGMAIAPLSSLVAHKIMEKQRKGVALSGEEYEFLCMYEDDLARKSLLAKETEATKMKRTPVTEEDPSFETAIENWESGKELTDEEEEILSETEEFDYLDEDDRDEEWEDFDEEDDWEEECEEECDIKEEMDRG